MDNYDERKLWNGAVVSYFKTEFRTTKVRSEKRTRDLLSTKQECQPFNIRIPCNPVTVNWKQLHACFQCNEKNYGF